MRAKSANSVDRAARRAKRRAAKLGGQAKALASGARVGYASPPVHTQFQKGRSGNPKGRPKGSLNLETIVRREAGRKIRLREGDQVRSVSRLEAIVLKIIEGALRGEPRAVVNFMKLAGALNNGANAEPAQDQLSETEEAVLRNLLGQPRGR